MKYILVILLFFPVLGYSQISIGIAPISVAGLGKAENVHMMEIAYGYFGAHYFLRSEEIIQYPNPPLSLNIYIHYHHNLALSYRYPFTDYLRVGVISFTGNFPEPSGGKLNLWVDIGVDISRIRVSYIHISNAFRYESNLGYDAVLVSLRF